ncbi:unnamed protein product [Caenorhabditis auriculariae]|uniref:Uncharacterized protein n=1 Tax=Caenorhabditis auriculariae TaxID=2777116 RepID=A0A8S1HSC9_9PELO|nr:unnamed protein product [Caenorhabditis auriculariae]
MEWVLWQNSMEMKFLVAGVNSNLLIPHMRKVFVNCATFCQPPVAPRSSFPNMEKTDEVEDIIKGVRSVVPQGCYPTGGAEAQKNVMIRTMIDPYKRIDL